MRSIESSRKQPQSQAHLLAGLARSLLFVDLDLLFLLQLPLSIRPRRLRKREGLETGYAIEQLLAKIIQDAFQHPGEKFRKSLDSLDQFYAHLERSLTLLPKAFESL